MIHFISHRIPLLLMVIGAAVATCWAGPAAAAKWQGCLDYEPANVSLSGVIVRRTVTNVSDRKETIWILTLAKPVCVNARGDDDFNVKRSRVTDVQLALEPDMYNKYRRLLGKRVTATGTLFGQHTAHHFTPVLLDVAAINPRR